MSTLKGILAWMLGGAAARVLTGAGLALATFAALTPLVLSALNIAAAAWSGLPSAVAQIMLLSGLGESLSAVGSAMLTRIAIESAKVSIVAART